MKTKTPKHKVKYAPAKRRKKVATAVVREDSPEWSAMQTASRQKYRTPSVALNRKYAVTTVSDAKKIAKNWLASFKLENAVDFGLPEVDDRYHVWRVPLVKQGSSHRVGELVLDAYNSMVLAEETTKPDVIESRLLGRGESAAAKAGQPKMPEQMQASFMRNTVILGDCEQALLEMPSQSIDLVFTSPPYFNARPEYEDYLTYEEYLLKMRRVIHNCHQVLGEGRMAFSNN
jgi:hypothetical protein